MTSFIVYAENHARAEKRGVAECEARIIIVGVIPETLRGNSDALTSNLSDDCLNDDFVRRDVEQFHLRLYLLNDVFDLRLGLSLIILLAFELLLDYVFNDVSHLGRVKSTQ